MRILLGYNGSKTSMAALGGLALMGLSDADSVIVIFVTDTSQNVGQTTNGSELTERAAEHLRGTFHGMEVITHLADGSPADEIVAAANAFDIDIIVIGGRVDRAGSKATLGQTAQSVLTKAECTVRIVREPDKRSDHVERLLVAFDGSAGAINAVNSIAARKWESRPTVRLLAVADSSVLSSIGRFMPQMRDSAVETQFVEQWAETLAAASLRRLRSAGIESSVCLRFGDPRDEIIRVAADWNADTVFLGPHAHPNSFERSLIGSVSAAVATQARCSVEIVRS